LGPAVCNRLRLSIDCENAAIDIVSSIYQITFVAILGISVNFIIDEDDIHTESKVVCMIDWDHDGDIDAQDIGLSVMMLDDISSEDQSRRKRKRGCFGGCLGTALIGLAFAGILGCIVAFLMI